MKVSIVIPTLNEKEAIPYVLKKIPENFAHEVIVADNGSTDKTVKLAKKHGAKVIHIKKRGYGCVYKEAFKHVKGDIIATMDGDDTYNPNDIFRLVETLKGKKVDFVSGNRLKNIHPKVMPFLRILANYLDTFLCNLFFSTNIQDSQSGMWMFYSSLLDKLELKEDGMSFSTEIKLEACKKARFIEIPISYSKRKGKRKMSSFKQGLEILKFMLKRKFHKTQDLKK